jgi:hypothetical protein
MSRTCQHIQYWQRDEYDENLLTILTKWYRHVLFVPSSVVWHFGTDPDPGIRTTDLRIVIFCQRPSTHQQKIIFFPSFLLIRYFLKVKLKHSSKIKKVLTMSQNRKKSRFFLLFLLFDGRIRIRNRANSDGSGFGRSYGSRSTTLLPSLEIS